MMIDAPRINDINHLNCQIAVCGPTELRVTVIPQGTLSCPCGQFTLCRAYYETACHSSWVSDIANSRERHEKKKSSVVSPFAAVAVWLAPDDLRKGENQRVETIGIYPLAPLPGRQDSLASQAKTLISGMITKIRSNAAQSLLQIRRIVLNRLAKTLVHAILTRNTKRNRGPMHLPSVQIFKPAEKEPCFRTALQKICQAIAFAYCTPSSFARSWVLTAMSILLPLIAPPVSSAMNTP